jgi:hypothetical protein
LWIESICLSCSWTASPDIDARCCATCGNHDGGACLPPAADPLKVPDVDAVDVGD